MKGEVTIKATEGKSGTGFEICVDLEDIKMIDIAAMFDGLATALVEDEGKKKLFSILSTTDVFDRINRTEISMEVPE